MIYQNIHDITSGRWHGILVKLGLDQKFLTKRNGPCPMCDGKDRWRWTDHERRGGWVCTHCGRGDGFKFVMLWKGLTFIEAKELVAAAAGHAAVQSEPERDETALRDAMRAVWAMGRPVTPDCPVGLYLARRIPGLKEIPKSIRYVPELRHEKVYYPAMICKVISADGSSAVNIHRTWLTEDGNKAPIVPVRKVMKGYLPKGCAIRLFPCENVLGIAEGIETALAASYISGLPVWSVISAQNMKDFIAPECVKELVICGDNDLNFVGQSGSYTCASKNAMRSKDLQVTVKIPTGAGADWADVNLSNKGVV